jgi:hypothetical protein
MARRGVPTSAGNRSSLRGERRVDAVVRADSFRRAAKADRRLMMVVDAPAWPPPFGVDVADRELAPECATTMGAWPILNPRR